MNTPTLYNQRNAEQRVRPAVMHSHELGVTPPAPLPGLHRIRFCSSLYGEGGSAKRRGWMEWMGGTPNVERVIDSAISV